MLKKLTGPIRPPHVVALAFAVLMSACLAALKIPELFELLVEFAYFLVEVSPILAVFAMQAIPPLVVAYLVWALLSLPMPRWASAAAAAVIVGCVGGLAATPDLLPERYFGAEVSLLALSFGLSAYIVFIGGPGGPRPVGSPHAIHSPLLRNLLLLRWLAWVEDEGELVAEGGGIRRTSPSATGRSRARLGPTTVRRKR